jgi:aminopeptidase N
VVRRLAELGGIGAPEIDAERLRDGTAAGELGAAAALAARPTPAAKSAAWSAMTEDPEISARRFRALATGLWSSSRHELAEPYIDAYVGVAPALARRGSAFAAVVGRAFPPFWLTATELAKVNETLQGDLPAVLRRHWQDEIDDRQ